MFKGASPDLNESPAATYEQWRALVEQDLDGAPFERKLVTHTYEGLYLQPLYTAADWSPGGEGEAAGRPPYTRGSHLLGHARTGWDIRQEHAERSIRTLNRSILDDLQGGATSLLLRLDAAMRNGMDADDPAAATLAGVDGAMLYSPADFQEAFKGVHLGMIGVALEAGAAFVPASALLASLWVSQGLTPAEARGAFNADPLAVLARDGRLPFAASDAMRQLGELAVWTDARYPRVTSVRVGTAPYHHAGATATQDLAFAMATALEYLRAMEAAGLPVERAARQILFSFAVGCNFFLAAAKLRAARRMWSRVVETCGGGPDAQRMAMHVRLSKRVMTTRDPWVNLLRNSVAVFAGAIAGADVITSEPFDRALGTPGELGRRVARNTHLILQEECHLHRVADPPGGSWYLERLTDELAEKAWVILQAIEARGGMAASLADGWITQQIDTAMGPRLRNLATRRDAITGVSEFPSLAESVPGHVEEPIQQALAEARERLRVHRANHASDADLAARAIPGTDRPHLAFQAACAGATIGRLARACWKSGETQLAAPVHVHPFAEPFEHLRDASDRCLAECGHRPRVFLASMGPLAEHTPRTTYARNFFEAGGFHVLASDGYPTAEAAAAALRTSGATLAVICGADKNYEGIISELAPALHRAGARTVVLAGNPGEREAAYRAAGVDRFIFVKCDVVRTLTELLAEEGVMA